MSFEQDSLGEMLFDQKSSVQMTFEKLYFSEVIQLKFIEMSSDQISSNQNIIWQLVNSLWNKGLLTKSQLTKSFDLYSFNQKLFDEKSLDPKCFDQMSYNQKFFNKK